MGHSLLCSPGARPIALGTSRHLVSQGLCPLSFPRLFACGPSSSRECASVVLRIHPSTSFVSNVLVCFDEARKCSHSASRLFPCPPAISRLAGLVPAANELFLFPSPRRPAVRKTDNAFLLRLCRGQPVTLAKELLPAGRVLIHPFIICCGETVKRYVR